MDKKKILYSLLKEINDGNRPIHDDYGINYEEFGKVVEMATKEGFLDNANVQRAGQGNKVIMIWLDNSIVTLKGLNYLDENSTLAKTYKGLKEARDWFKL